MISGLRVNPHAAYGMCISANKAAFTLKKKKKKKESGVAMSCGVGHRCGSDPARLWLLYRLAAAALIRPLAWKIPYATGAALKKAKKKKN